MSCGIFETHYYVPLAEPSGTELGNTEELAGESPLPSSSSPGSQDTQQPANPGDIGDNPDNGKGFPIVPVVITVMGGV